MSQRARREFLTQIGRGAASSIAAAGIVGLQPAELLAFQASQPPSAGAAAARYANLTSDRYFSASELHSETDVAFLEGPAVDRAGNVFFTNYTLDQILKWEPAAKKLSVFRSPCGHANGLLFDRQGRLVACETDGRVTRTDLRTGQISVLCDQHRGYPLGAPNDVCADARGRLYFTSRLPNRDLAQGNVNAVYRIDPDGRVEQILAWPQIDMPNGIVTSPDDKLLYLIDSDGTEKGARRIRRYALRDDGTLADESMLYNFFPGRSGDGMEIDAEGNLYVAAGLHRRRATTETLDTRPGIHVISPEGKLLAFVETTEDTITNCAFGGEDLRTLYITCGKRLLSLPTKIPGKGAYRPEA